MRAAWLSAALALGFMLGGCFLLPASWPVDEAAVEDAAESVQSAARRVKGARRLSMRFDPPPDMARWPEERKAAHEKARAAVEAYLSAEETLLTAENALLTALQDESLSPAKRGAVRETARQAEMDAFAALGAVVEALSEWTPPPLPAERESESVGLAAYLTAYDRLRAAERALDGVGGTQEAVQQAREALWAVKARAGVFVWGWEPSEPLEADDYSGSVQERADREIERSLREAQKYAIFSYESRYRNNSLRRYGWHQPDRRWKEAQVQLHESIARSAYRWHLSARAWREASEQEREAVEKAVNAARAVWEAAAQTPEQLNARRAWENREEIRCADAAVAYAYRSVDAHTISSNMFLWDAENMRSLERPSEEKRAAFRAEMEKLAYYLHHLCAAKAWRSTLTDINANADAKRAAQNEAVMSRYMDGPFKDMFMGHTQLYGHRDHRERWEEPLTPFQPPAKQKSGETPASAGR